MQLIFYYICLIFAVLKKHLTMKFIFYTIFLFFGIFLLGNLQAQTADAGPDQEICSNHTFLNAIEAPSGFTGTWTVISGYCIIADIHAFNTEITGLLSGPNELKWTVTDGTTTTDDNVIILNNTPSQAQTGDDEAICVDYFTLSANAYNTEESGIWSVEFGSGTFTDPALNFTDVTGIAQGINTYRWTITRGICSVFDEISITNNQVDADAGIDQTTCNNYTTLAATNPTLGTGTWSVVSSSGSPVFSDIHSSVSSITGLGINTNSLQWTVINANCSDYDNVIITSNKPTTANAGTDKTICSSSTGLSANNPTYGTGQWSVESGSGNFANVNGYNTNVSNLSPGNNRLKWTITYNSCPSEDEVDIFYDYFTADAGVDDATCNNSYTLNGNNPSPAPVNGE